jgi:hypothetical protein
MLQPTTKAPRKCEGTPEVNADHYPVSKDTILKLIPQNKLKKLKQGTTVISIVGDEYIVGEADLDFETTVFGRSKYGEKIDL